LGKPAEKLWMVLFIIIVLITLITLLTACTAVYIEDSSDIEVITLGNNDTEAALKK